MAMAMAMEQLISRSWRLRAITCRFLLLLLLLLRRDGRSAAPHCCRLQRRHSLEDGVILQAMA
jgi:hypothetical protein